MDASARSHGESREAEWGVPVELGLGLISIGRPWGYVKTGVPEPDEAKRFLAHAFECGMRFFDTAPAYGASEEILGEFLRNLSPSDRNKITVATKFGEFWDREKRATYIDHSAEAMRGSIDASLERLGRVDILQLHKTNPVILQSPDLRAAAEYAGEKGVRWIGASVGDVESGIMACRSDVFSAIQFPYNQLSSAFAGVMDMAMDSGKFIIVNRPFGMGQAIAAKTGVERFQGIVAAFRHILNRRFSGVVLSGTKSREHLEMNMRAFRQAMGSIRRVRK